MSRGPRTSNASLLLDRFSWPVRLILGAFFLSAVGVVWITNTWLTDRFTQDTRNRAEVRLALYSGNLLSELQRASVVPLLLSRDNTLLAALNSEDFSQSSQRLIYYVEEIGAASITMLNAEGRVVAASDRELISSNLSDFPPYLEALNSVETVFSETQTDAGATAFTYSRAMIVDREVEGVIVVAVDLAKFEQAWAGISDAVLVTNTEERIILASEPRWKALSVEEALSVQSAESAIRRAIRATADWAALPSDAFLLGETVMRNEARIRFQGWRILSFTSYASVRERVNTFLALEIMVFALLLSAAFYGASRRARSRAVFFKRESAELRVLNDRLQREIAEREKAEKNLQVAEQTLEQSSKLAALGEMSAAVSHELNQPLAAMKTYLAGARLLLQRKRPEEALSSFLRIDDLIERMGAITKQLKSYARKGEQAFEPLDYRECVSSALSMMEPQLRQRKVTITRTLPPSSVLIMADRIRLEQVIINLLRNALDATKQVSDAQVDLILSAGEVATLTVRDNGHGIEDLDALFEPFYTTKAPGDGVGLGLAISSGIVNDHGGRLTAHESADGGAVFELQLPIMAEDVAAAE